MYSIGFLAYYRCLDSYSAEEVVIGENISKKNKATF